MIMKNRGVNNTVNNRNSCTQAYNCVCFYPVIVRPLLLYTKYIYTRTRTRTRLECTHRGGEACRYHKPSDTCVVRDV